MDKILKKQIFFDVFKKIKEDAPLENEEKLIAEAILRHPEYHCLMKGQNVYILMGKQFDMDPFLHITLHFMIDRQRKESRPPVVSQVFDYLSQKEIPEHDIYHSLGLIMADELFNMLKEQRPFDEERYATRLEAFLKM